MIVTDLKTGKRTEHITKVYELSDWHDSETICRNYAYEAGLLRQEVRRWRNQARVNWWEGLIVGLVIATALFLLSPATPSGQVDESLSHKTQSDTSRFSTTVNGAGEAHVMESALPIGRRN